MWVEKTYVNSLCGGVDVIHYRDGDNIKHIVWGSVPRSVSVIRGDLWTGLILLWFYEKDHFFLLHFLLRLCWELPLCQHWARCPWWTPSLLALPSFSHVYDVFWGFCRQGTRIPHSEKHRCTESSLPAPSPAASPQSMPGDLTGFSGHRQSHQGGEEPECSLSSSNKSDATMTSACTNEAKLSRLRASP